MSDIFISYATADRKRAKQIADALAEKGWSVWWDRRIPPGKTFSRVIKQAIDEAKCVVVLWSENSVESDWVHIEAAEGAKRKILVPALIEEVKIPFEFERIHAASLKDWPTSTSHTAFDEFIRSIGALPGVPEPAAPKNSSRPTMKRTAVGPKPAVKPAPVKARQTMFSTAKKMFVHDSYRNYKWFVFVIALVSALGFFYPELRQFFLPTRPVAPGLTSKDVVIAVAEKKSTSTSPARKKSVTRYKLRKKALTLSKDNVKKMVKKYDYYCTDKYSWSKPHSNPKGKGLVNDFTIQKNGKVIYDAATGLTWQQSGSSQYILFSQAQTFIKQLNKNNFAGYSDWRLPTLEEAMSLMKSKRNSAGAFIDPVFDAAQRWIWTADKYSASAWWGAYFAFGVCNGNVDRLRYVRAVR